MYVLAWFIFNRVISISQLLIFLLAFSMQLTIYMRLICDSFNKYLLVRFSSLFC